MAASSRTTVVVVAHNAGSDLAKLLHQLTSQAHCIVVDNVSTDGSAEGLSEDIELVASPVNLGFGRACNKAFERVTTEFVLILNPDTVVASDLVESLEAAADEHPNVALFGCRVLNPDGTVQAATYRSLPTVASGVRQGFGAGPASSHIQSDFVRPVSAVNGAAMFIRSRQFELVGGFDEGFFLHCEDLDLFARLQNSGQHLAVLDRVDISHVKGGSGRHRWFVEFHKHRGMVRYFKKHLAGDCFWLVRALMPIAIWIRFVVFAPLWWLAALFRR